MPGAPAHVTPRHGTPAHVTQAILEGVETVTNLQSWHLTAVGGFRRGEEEGDGAHFILHRQGSEGQNITHDEVLAGKVSVIRSLHDWLLDKGERRTSAWRNTTDVRSTISTLHPAFSH